MNVLSKLKLRYQITPILKANKISYCALFGSRARNDYNKDSDFDFLVDFLPKQWPTLFSMAHIKNELEDRLNKQVDLVSRRNLKPSIRPYVQKDLITIYEER